MVRLTIHNTVTQAWTDCTEESQLIYDAISYVVPNLEILKRRNRKLKHWDGKKSFFDRRSRIFLTGFLPMVEQALKRNGVHYEVNERRRPPDVVIPRDAEVADILKGITLRPYQLRAVKDILTSGRGVCHIATGGGKTEIAIAVTRIIGLKTLFLTHRSHLLMQTAKRFIDRMPEADGRLGVVGDGYSNYMPITVATVQTLDVIFREFETLKEAQGKGMTEEAVRDRLKALEKMRLRDANEEAEFKCLEGLARIFDREPMIVGRHAELSEYLKSIEVLIIDEAHRASAKYFYRPALHCTNAFYRIGLTATPFMKGMAHDDMLLMGLTGPTMTLVSNGELIEAGVLARPFFKFFEVNVPDGIRSRSYREAYRLGIVRNVFRNKLICSQAKRLMDMGKKILVIVKEKEHGKILEDLLSEEGVPAQYIDGANTSWERSKAIKALRKGSISALVATNIMDEGVDCDVLSAIILAAGEKSAPALFQRTGRAMRKKAEGNYAVVIDFIDKQHRQLFDHSMRRYELVKNESGFTIL